MSISLACLWDMYPSCHCKALTVVRIHFISCWIVATLVPSLTDSSSSLSPSVCSASSGTTSFGFHYTPRMYFVSMSVFINDFNRIQATHSSSLHPLGFWQLHVRYNLHDASFGAASFSRELCDIEDQTVHQNCRP